MTDFHGDEAKKNFKKNVRLKKTEFFNSSNSQYLLAKIYRVERMDYSGFQPKTIPAQRYSKQHKKTFFMLYSCEHKSGKNPLKCRSVEKVLDAFE